MGGEKRREVKMHRATHPSRTKETGNTVNYEALYVSSNHRGTGRDSIGYEILREQAYAAQHCGYVIESSPESDEI